MTPTRLARALLIAALLFGLTAAPSVAQEQQQPNDNVVTTTSCTQGVLSDDGQYCIVPRLDVPAPAPAPAPGQPVPLDAPVPSFTG